MAVDLKPCPFCGGPAEIREGEEAAYVQCLDVKMHRAIWFSGDNNAANEVAEQWNQRAQSPDWSTLGPELVEALKPFEEIDGEDTFEYPPDKQVVVTIGGHTDYTLTLGDFRRVRDLLSRAQALTQESGG